MGDKTYEAIEDCKFLQTVINNNGFVAIGEHIFKLNFEKEKVFVIKKEDKTFFEELKMENSSHPNVMVFSMEDDVLPLLAEGYTESPTIGSEAMRTSSIFCKGACNGSTKITKDDNGKYYVGVKIKYTQAGVYYRLRLTTFELSSSSFGAQHHVEYDVQYKKQCNNNKVEKEAKLCSNGYSEECYSSKTSLPIFDDKVLHLNYGLDGFYHEFNEDFFEDIYGLKKMYVKLTLHPVGLSWDASPTRTRTCNWN